MKSIEMDVQKTAISIGFGVLGLVFLYANGVLLVGWGDGTLSAYVLAGYATIILTFATPVYLFLRYSLVLTFAAPVIVVGLSLYDHVYTTPDIPATLFFFDYRILGLILAAGLLLGAIEAVTRFVLLPSLDLSL